MSHCAILYLIHIILYISIKARKKLTPNKFANELSADISLTNNTDYYDVLKLFNWQS